MIVSCAIAGSSEAFVSPSAFSPFSRISARPVSTISGTSAPALAKKRSGFLQAVDLDVNEDTTKQQLIGDDSAYFSLEDQASWISYW